MIKQFNCPECGEHRLEEVMDNVTVSSVIETIGVESNGVADLVYGEQTNEDGDIQCYQCVGCGFVLKDRDDREIDTPEELNDWILCHQPE